MVRGRAVRARSFCCWSARAPPRQARSIGTGPQASSRPAPCRQAGPRCRSRSRSRPGRTFRSIVTGLGTVQASFTIAIHPQVDGIMQQVLFTEGQHVKKGDVLARIDPRLYQAALDQAKAKQIAGRRNADRRREGSRALQDPGGAERRHRADSSTSNRRRSISSRLRSRPMRPRSKPPRRSSTTPHQGAERRPHRRAPGRSRQSRACLRYARRSPAWC